MDGPDFIVRATKYPLIDNQKAVLKKYKREIVDHLKEIECEELY